MGFFDKLFGRNKNASNRIQTTGAELPKALSQVTLQDSLGNLYTVHASETAITENYSPNLETQQQVRLAQAGLHNTLQDLSQSDAQRLARVEERKNSLFQGLKSSINTTADAQRARLKSEAAKRFGGVLNSSFSALGLQGLAQARLQALESAYSGSLSLALQEQDTQDASRERRFRILNTYLDGIEERKRYYSSAGFNAIVNSKLARQNALQRLQEQHSQAVVDVQVADINRNATAGQEVLNEALRIYSLQNGAQGGGLSFLS